MSRMKSLADQPWVITSIIDSSVAIDIPHIADGESPKIYKVKQDKMSQVWKTKYDPVRDAYQIISVRNDKFSIGFDEMTKMANVAEKKDADDAYFWKLEKIDDFYNIINYKNPELLLEISNSQTMDGTLLIVGPQTSEKKQVWQFIAYQRSNTLTDINGDLLVNGRKYKPLVDQNIDFNIIGYRQLTPAKPVQKNIYFIDGESSYVVEFDDINDVNTRIWGQYDNYKINFDSAESESGEERASYAGYWNGEGHRPIFPDGRIYVRGSSWSYFKLTGKNGFGYTLSYQNSGETQYHEVGVSNYYNSLTTDRETDYEDAVAQFNFVPVESSFEAAEINDKTVNDYLLDNYGNVLVTGRTYALGYKNSLSSDTWYNLQTTAVNGESLLTRTETPVVLNNKDRYKYGFRIYGVDSFINDVPVYVGKECIIQELVMMDNNNYQVSGRYLSFDNYEVKLTGQSNQIPVTFLKDESGKGIHAYIRQDAIDKAILASTWRSADVYVYVIDPNVVSPVKNDLDTLLLYPVD